VTLAVVGVPPPTEGYDRKASRRSAVIDVNDLSRPNENACHLGRAEIKSLNRFLPLAQSERDQPAATSRRTVTLASRSRNVTYAFVNRNLG